jgi:hypothetical protein
MVVVRAANVVVISPMRAAYLALPLLLAGCGDSLYYQTRASPEGGSDFGFTSWLFQSEASEVYELPARPPAVSNEIEDMHLERQECRRPGQPFKDRPLAGVYDEANGSLSTNAIQPIAKLDDQPLTSGSTTPPVSQPIAGWRDPVQTGAREPQEVTRIGGYDTRPRSQPASGVTTIPSTPLAAYQDDDRWCPTPVKR